MTRITIFGYGSLVWRPGFEFHRKTFGFIKGYRRVFWQGSTDHRGTPEAPGRTVTLHEEEGAVTWGVAYELAGSEQQQQETIKYLEWREKQYDIRRLCHIYTADSPDEPVMRDVLVYIASDSAANVNWLGPAPLPAIAQQIATSHGPSGPNFEYLFGLADAMRQMGVDDQELFVLEQMVKQLMAAGVQSQNHTVATVVAAEGLITTAAEAIATASVAAAAAVAASGGDDAALKPGAATAAATAAAQRAIHLTAVAVATDGR